VSRINNHTHPPGLLSSAPLHCLSCFFYHDFSFIILTNLCYACPKKVAAIVKENSVRSHVTELKGQADLGISPKSVQPIRGENYSTTGKAGENPIAKHVNELKGQASLRGEPAPLQPNHAEQRARERLAKPPPEEAATIFNSAAQDLGDRGKLPDHPLFSQVEQAPAPELQTPYELLHPILRTEWRDFIAGLEHLDAEFLAKHKYENVTNYLLSAVLDLALRPIPNLTRKYGGAIHADILVAAEQHRLLAIEKLTQQWREKGIM
jgi:hypothetical protein